MELVFEFLKTRALVSLKLAYYYSVKFYSITATVVINISIMNNI